MLLEFRLTFRYSRPGELDSPGEVFQVTCNVERAMIEEIGINILVPILVFLWIIVGAHVVSDEAFKDVLKRRAQDQE